MKGVIGILLTVTELLDDSGDVFLAMACGDPTLERLQRGGVLS